MILGFSTAGPYCGAALFDGAEISSALHEELAKGQAERLMPMLEEVLQAGGASFDDLKGIGVGIGPGNFTGIRIAVSAARGLAMGLGIPAVGVSVLEALVHGHERPRLGAIGSTCNALRKLRRVGRNWCMWMILPSGRTQT
jgi:tRNA threonylcarbamoyl adenosine modification protein YeaZ